MCGACQFYYVYIIKQRKLANRMDLDKIFIRPQPCSQPLRTVARILAERESDAAAVAQLLVFLERSGIFLGDKPQE